LDRVFLPAECFEPEAAIITGASRKHLAGSLRVRTGDSFLATDGVGFEYLLRARDVTRERIVATIVERREREPRAQRFVTLAISPPRGGRMEIAIEKTVECGVGRIVPLRTEHSVLKSRDDSSRKERWQRVACSATAQSGRTWVPEIAPVATFEEALAEAASGRILLAHPGEISRPLASALAGLRSGEGVAIFVGPEGGFSSAELEKARRSGAIEATLGPHRLRSETAAIVAVAWVVAFVSELAPRA
jgi:16S rRNA (uracil1498-N3)-methyltransferase